VRFETNMFVWVCEHMMKLAKWWIHVLERLGHFYLELVVFFKQSKLLFYQRLQEIDLKIECAHILDFETFGNVGWNGVALASNIMILHL